MKDKNQKKPAVCRDKFLIVEDEVSLAELLSFALRRQGETEIATNGELALEKVREKHFDVIICDVGMPVMDGIEFYKKAVASDPDIGKRFIFYTGLPTPENIEFFEKENVKYLIKPASLMELQTLISDILGETAAQQS